MARVVLILALLSSPTVPLTSLSMCSCRVCSVPLPGDPDHVAAQHVLYGSSPREGGVRDVLPGSSAVPQLLLAFPHCLLSLREGLTDFLEVSQHECGCVVSWEVLGSCSPSSWKTLCSQMFYVWEKGASTQSSIELRGITAGFWRVLPEHLKCGASGGLRCIIKILDPAAPKGTGSWLPSE